MPTATNDEREINGRNECYCFGCSLTRETGETIVAEMRRRNNIEISFSRRKGVAKTIAVSGGGRNWGNFNDGVRSRACKNDRVFRNAGKFSGGAEAWCVHELLRNRSRQQSSSVRHHLH